MYMSMFYSWLWSQSNNSSVLKPSVRVQIANCLLPKCCCQGAAGSIPRIIIELPNAIETGSISDTQWLHIWLLLKNTITIDLLMHSFHFCWPQKSIELSVIDSALCLPMSFNPSWATFGVIDFSRLKGCTFRALAASRCLASLAGLAFATFGRRGRLSTLSPVVFASFSSFSSRYDTQVGCLHNSRKSTVRYTKNKETTWKSC